MSEHKVKLQKVKLGMISTELKVKLPKTFKQLLPACDLRVIFKVSLRMKNYFNFKDKIKR